MSPLYCPHFCWPDESTYGGRLLSRGTSPSMWLAPKNPNLHKCQRCSYIVWRDASDVGAEKP